MRHLDLCSGIGGFALAASWVWPDHEVAAFVEVDPWCRSVLRKHWPDAPQHDDLKTYDARPLRGRVDLLTAGFPCQPFSSASAGRALGKKDDRYLWPEVRRVVDECRPRWVCLENVPRLDGMGLEQVVSELEASAYTVGEPMEVPACAVGLDHHRPRLWVLAHADGEGEPGLPIDGEVAELPGGRGDAGGVGAPDGVPAGLDTDRARLRALGNAIVPQVAAEILRSVKLADAEARV